MDKSETDAYVRAVGIDQKVYNIERIKSIISLRIDFMSPGDRNGLPDVLSFKGIFL
jgi:hypothetical protein